MVLYAPTSWLHVLTSWTIVIASCSHLLQVNGFRQRRRREAAAEEFEDTTGSSYWGPVDMNTEDGASLTDPCKASKSRLLSILTSSHITI